MEPLFDPTFLQTLDRLTFTTRRALAGHMQGERRSPRRGTSVEFADYRPYTVGDDIRQIDWNLYARMERFFLKIFLAEEELTIHLLLDTSASMNWGDPNKFPYAIRLAAAAGYIALSSMERVTLSAFGATTPDKPAASGLRTMPPVRGRRGVSPLFAFLQQLTPDTTGNLVSTCHRYAQTTRTPGLLILCSDLLDPNWHEALRALTSRPFDITLFHVLAPQEQDPQLDGDFRLIDSEGGPAVDITADLDTLQRYQQNLDRWRREVEAFCQGRSINYLFVDTAVPVETFLLTQLRQRGVVHSW